MAFENIPTKKVPLSFAKSIAGTSTYSRSVKKTKNVRKAKPRKLDYPLNTEAGRSYGSPLSNFFDSNNTNSGHFSSNTNSKVSLRTQPYSNDYLSDKKSQLSSNSKRSNTKFKVNSQFLNSMHQKRLAADRTLKSRVAPKLGRDKLQVGRDQLHIVNSPDELVSLTFKNNSNTTNVFHINNYVKATDRSTAKPAIKKTLTGSSANIERLIQKRQIKKTEPISKSRISQKSKVATLDTLLKEYSRQRGRSSKFV